jgi:hypothetical protein
MKAVLFHADVGYNWHGEGIYKDLVRSTPAIPVEATPAP